MAIGAPEDLVLQGRLGEPSAPPASTLMCGRGTFALKSPQGRPVTVVGDGADAMWMRRALERSGFQLCEEACAIEVTRRSNGGAPSWHLRANGCVSEHLTIQSVLEALQGNRV